VKSSGNITALTLIQIYGIGTTSLKEYATLNASAKLLVHRYNMNLRLSRAQHREEMQIVEKLS